MASIWCCYIYPSQDQRPLTQISMCFQYYKYKILPSINYYILYFFSYKSRDDFIADVRIIFDNCEIFNEDDSPVGKAGHCLRKFFEARWAELTDHHKHS